MSLRQIADRSWSTSACAFYECQSCGIVDRDNGRIKYGHECSRCGKPGSGATGYFPLNLKLVVNTIQDMHFLTGATVTRNGDNGPEWYPFDTDTRPIAALLLCTVYDIATSVLATTMMNRIKVPGPIQDQLLKKDYRHSRERMELLYPVLAGEKVADSLAEILASDGVDHSPVFDYMRSIAAGRNKFVHAGHDHGFTAADLDRVPEQLVALLEAIVALNNRHVLRNP